MEAKKERGLEKHTPLKGAAPWIYRFWVDFTRSTAVGQNGGLECGHSCVLNSHAHSRPKTRLPSLPRLSLEECKQEVSHSVSTPRSRLQGLNDTNSPRTAIRIGHHGVSSFRERWPASTCWPAPKHVEERARGRHGEEQSDSRPVSWAGPARCSPVQPGFETPNNRVVSAPDNKREREPS